MLAGIGDKWEKERGRKGGGSTSGTELSEEAQISCPAKISLSPRTMAIPKRQLAICIPNLCMGSSDASRVIHPVLDVHGGWLPNQPGGRWYSSVNSWRKEAKWGQSAK